MPSDESSTTTTWDGFSDYERVSNRITASIHDAIEGYSTVQRAHEENARFDPEDAATAGSRIMSAALSVLTELEAYADENDEYQKLLDRFNGDDGYLQKLRDAQLRTECPEWLYDFVVDIRRAGFKLGYLKAGRESEQRDDDSPESEAREMFADL